MGICSQNAFWQVSSSHLNHTLQIGRAIIKRLLNCGKLGETRHRLHRNRVGGCAGSLAHPFEKLVIF
jgi:hypothetical protein